MQRLLPTQLELHLHKKLQPCYLLVGHDAFLQIESVNLITDHARQAGFSKQQFTLDNQTDWLAIFDSCQTLSLFTQKTLLVLSALANGLNTSQTQKLQELAALLHNDIIIVLQIEKLTKAQENSKWCQALSQQGHFVNCQTPEQKAFISWITEKATKAQLKLDTASLQTLAHYYEGNLLALSQLLSMLQLLYPDGNITLPRLENQLFNAAYFTPYHWLDALLAGNTERAWHIMQSLKANDTEILILLRILQKELLLLLNLQRQSQQQPLKPLFDQYNIWQQRRTLLTQALQRLTLPLLNQAINTLMKLELSLKIDYSESTWQALETLTLSLCTGTFQKHE